MTDYKCGVCGSSFASKEALQSHAHMKASEESPHFRKMLAHEQVVPISPDEQEKPK